ncbi:hypothetical protein IG631_21211 [Alternaria alternata]|nr:hypothetical protein IG631_21211 [Alternaria alternata]
MHLLQKCDANSFRLVELFDDAIPKYAILSHTWGSSDDEVSYQDLQNNTAGSKKGYDKLIFCGNQAMKDGLQYFWVDTCCINKHSSAELSEAINSMFRWYQRASRCYVYLSDVTLETQGDIENESTSHDQWKQAFRKSRWFTRSWTLQELLAPESVEFFSANHEWLGSKEGLLEDISHITGIPRKVLRDQRTISDFDAKQRMSWACNRGAKREEDCAYSLLGICGVHMPLIYGEGRKQALKRLRKAIKESKEDDSDDYHEPPMGPSTYKNYFYNAYDGTQYNNTGSGTQIFGDFAGPVNFK